MLYDSWLAILYSYDAGRSDVGTPKFHKEQKKEMMIFRTAMIFLTSEQSRSGGQDLGVC